MAEKIKIVFAALLVIAGIALFYYFADKPMIVRVGGVLAGIIPARHAAAIRPIEALRAE